MVKPTTVAVGDGVGGVGDVVEGVAVTVGLEAGLEVELVVAEGEDAVGLGVGIGEAPLGAGDGEEVHPTRRATPTAAALAARARCVLEVTPRVWRAHGPGRSAWAPRQRAAASGGMMGS